MNVRLPAVAGFFYEKEPVDLREQVRRCLPDPAPPREIALGAVVPHAGLLYSGSVAGAVYASLALPETVILLGPNHTGEGLPLSLSPADCWETPLGRVATDRQLAKHLLKAIPGLKSDEAAHRQEHALEVQLPFIQLLAEGIKVVAITLGFESVRTYQDFGEDLASVLREFPRRALVLASSDMTHYEPQPVVVRKDRQAIEAILVLDEERLVKRIEEEKITMCGYAPTVAMLSCIKRLGAKAGRLVLYRTSGDASGDYSAVVGYAGILLQ